MVDLRNIKLVFADYDDTLCIHRYIEVDRPTFEDWINAKVNGDEMYYINPQFDYSPAVKYYINVLFKQGVEMYSLTWSNTNSLCDARKKFLSLCYGKDVFKDVIITNARYAKVEIAKDYAKVKGIAHKNILIIEDHPETLSEFRREGFSAVSVSELSMMYENRLLDIINSTYNAG